MLESYPKGEPVLLASYENIPLSLVQRGRLEEISDSLSISADFKDLFVAASSTYLAGANLVSDENIQSDLFTAIIERCSEISETQDSILESILPDDCSDSSTAKFGAVLVYLAYVMSNLRDKSKGYGATAENYTWVQTIPITTESTLDQERASHLLGPHSITDVSVTNRFQQSNKPYAPPGAIWKIKIPSIMVEFWLDGANTDKPQIAWLISADLFKDTEVSGRVVPTMLREGDVAEYFDQDMADLSAAEELLRLSNILAIYGSAIKNQNESV